MPPATPAPFDRRRRAEAAALIGRLDSGPDPDAAFAAEVLGLALAEALARLEARDPGLAPLVRARALAELGPP